jgi:hypothetical protein
MVVANDAITKTNLANMTEMIEIKRWFWNDKEVTKEEHEELVEAWKRTVEESEKNQEPTDKPKRKKK